MDNDPRISHAPQTVEISLATSDLAINNEDIHIDNTHGNDPWSPGMDYKTVSKNKSYNFSDIIQKESTRYGNR